MTQTAESIPRKSLRLWPGVVVVVLQWFLRFVLPNLIPEATLIGILGGTLLIVAVIVWWLFFSRAPWMERLIGILLMVAAAYVTSRIAHESIQNGMMGMMPFMYAIPLVCLGLVVGALAGRHLSSGARTATIAVAIFVACGALALLRTNGITGDADSDFQWRWTKDAEEQLLEKKDEVAALPPAPATPQPPAKPIQTQPSQEPDKADEVIAKKDDKPSEIPTTQPEVKAEWPGFRGAERDSVVHGVQIATDWSASKPVQLWKRPVGPAWSSFAVRGNRFYTQEQRGEEEVVACYNLKTGKPVWKHRDVTRFWESNAGAGPRGTPTISNGRIYSFGATGIVNALDADNGARVWSRNAGTDTGRRIPDWGFSSSPLVVDDIVVVAAAGKLVAYDVSTGNPRWFGPDDKSGYSSPHLITIDGTKQILFMSGKGATSLAPENGQVLWKYSLPGVPIVQPAVISDGDVLITESEASGKTLRRLGVSHASNAWTVKERWSTMGMKPYFNDFVVHNGHAYGFDGAFLACIDIADGSRKWKGKGYGHGQLLLLADQDLLLILSEQGELGLVKATPNEFQELGKIPAIEGKTWNHPVLVGNIVLVRNSEEMAAFQLPTAND